MVEERVLSQVIAGMETELKKQSVQGSYRDAPPPLSGAHEPLRPFMSYAPPAQRLAAENEKSKKTRSGSRLDEINRILQKLQNESAGVEASALISEDGLIIASFLTADMDETRVAGMAATLQNLGARAATELTRGNVREIVVRGEIGYAIMINAGRGALLLALSDESGKLGLIFFDMLEAIKALQEIL
jgi:predicted regulator of Ras-like GTPase activity (Roadblock/LC7/MglB family)